MKNSSIVPIYFTVIFILNLAPKFWINASSKRAAPMVSYSEFYILGGKESIISCSGCSGGCTDLTHILHLTSNPHPLNSQNTRFKSHEEKVWNSTNTWKLRTLLVAATKILQLCISSYNIYRVDNNLSYFWKKARKQSC